MQDNIIEVNISKRLQINNVSLKDEKQNNILRMELTRYLCKTSDFGGIFQKPTWRLSEYCLLLKTLLNNKNDFEVKTIKELCESHYETEDGKLIKFNIEDYI